jgi:hypothetical protein
MASPIHPSAASSTGQPGLLLGITLLACCAPMQQSSSLIPHAVEQTTHFAREPEAPSLAKNTGPSAQAAGPALFDREPGAGTGCTQQLFARGVAFVPLQHSRGIASPVQLGDRVAGIRYQPTAAFPLVVDCRFALVLADMGGLLRRHQIAALQFSIAHAYRATRAGTLSLHANGLALDIHRAVLNDGTELSVNTDYVRHLRGRGCLPSARPLNQLACELAASGWFAELLTPDDNADHRDHFHLGIRRLASSATTYAPTPVKDPDPPRRE